MVEVWSLYERGLLTTDSVLTGRFNPKLTPVDLESVLLGIEDARFEEAARKLRMQDSE